LKDSIQQKPNDQEFDTSALTEEQLEAVNRIAEQKAKELLNTKEKSELVVKEEDAFLKANPQAYEKLDDIREFRKNNPSVSYAKAYKFFFEEEPEQVKAQGIKGNPPKSVVT
jgi:hypothetical protein